MKSALEVLAIEDNPYDAELISIMLESRAFSYVRASLLSEGLTFLKKGGFGRRDGGSFAVPWYGRCRDSRKSVVGWSL